MGLQHPRAVLRIYVPEHAAILERDLQDAADMGTLTSATALRLMADAARAAHGLGYAEGYREGHDRGSTS